MRSTIQELRANQTREHFIRHPELSQGIDIDERCSFDWWRDEYAQDDPQPMSYIELGNTIGDCKLIIERSLEGFVFKRMYKNSEVAKKTIEDCDTIQELVNNGAVFSADYEILQEIQEFVITDQDVRKHCQTVLCEVLEELRQDARVRNYCLQLLGVKP